ncbi:MAG: type II toxin-antitoxin system VapC family toxin [Spirochaetaceae bacterium]|nr:type II toxin-antitoxin system VapC family toxin [Spirochaetaceae bacterium]
MYNMELMIDASVLICIILNEPEKKKVISLTEETELVSPEIISFEIGNALSRMYKKHRLNEEQIVKSYELFETLPLRFVKVDMAKALKLSCKYSIYAYDAYYLETAYRLKLPLLTLDVLMKNTGKHINIDILEV